MKRVCSCQFFDSFLILIWMSIPVLAVFGGIMTAFPDAQHVVNDYGWITIGMSFIIFSAARFLTAYEWNAVGTIVSCFVGCVAVYWMLLYMTIFRSRPNSIFLACMIPACILSMLLPGIGYVWERIKPEPVMTTRSRYEIQKRRRPPRPPQSRPQAGIAENEPC